MHAGDLLKNNEKVELQKTLQIEEEMHKSSFDSILTGKRIATKEEIEFS